jgi:trk system potassium uptake protein TrkA
MKKQVAVIGMGRFGISIASTLCSLGHDVLVLDRREDKIQNMSQQVTHAIQGDATNETILKELGIGNFDVAIVAIGTEIESSVLSTILLKKLGVGHVIARANDDLHGSILEKIGADIVIYPEREMGTRVAQGVTLRDVSDYMSVATGYGVARLIPPSYLVGEKLSELGFGQKGKWEVAVLLIKREKEVIVTPGQGEVIKPGDMLIIAGNDDKVEKLLAEAKKNKENKEEKKNSK